MPDTYETELARLDIFISDAERCVQRQRELIERMRARDLPIQDACKTLDAMLNVLETLHHYRAGILRLSKDRLH